MPTDADGDEPEEDDEDEEQDDDAGEEQGDKRLEDCTDAELKAFIKRETGEAVKGNPSRQTLIERAMEIATSPEA